MTGTARSCTLTSGQATMVVSSNASLAVGATIQGTGIPSGTKITAINGTTVTMSANATTGGAQNLIFSSVYGSTLTVALSASADTATPQNILNAGFGVSLVGTTDPLIFFPGGLTVTWANIVSGAVFDFESWSLYFGNGGRWRFQESSILGELRGGYLVNGTQFLKSAGPTFCCRSWNNGGAGGSSMFESLGGTAKTGKFRMHNPRFIELSGYNASPTFYSALLEFDVENMVLDYRGDSAGANAGVGAAFGYFKNTNLVKTNGGIGSTNGSNYATWDGLIYTGNYQSDPQHKFSLPNNYVLDGYFPQVLATQYLGGFNNATLETYSNINLSTAGWGLNDLKTRYKRYGGPIELRFPRRVNFEINDSSAAGLSGVTLFIKSGSITVVNAVQTGDYDANTQALILNWNTSINSYRTCTSFIDTIAQVAQFRKYGYIEQSAPYNLNLDGYSQPIFMLSNAVLSTIDDAAANAISTVELDVPNKLIKITGVATLRQAYAKCDVELAKPANSDVVKFIDTDGDSLNVTGGWTFEIGASGVLNTSTALKQFKVDGEQVAIVSGGVVNVPYQDVDGLRVTVTNLDPEGFGITWYLRHRQTGGSTWTNVSGTGNTALILLSEGAYDVQVRAPGYDWESALSLNTDVSLSLSAALRFQVSANNTPQYEMPYSEALADAFQFDLPSNKVAVENETGAIIQPGFAELYRATQRIQHLPDLVWVWTSPVTANATSQKILIPDDNPISMFLTEGSNASVKITCPVIYSATGSSADDRVRGNADGFSIILGSPATAESAGLQAGIVAALGGPNYDGETHSLSIIKSVIDLIKTATDAVKGKTDNLPAEPAAVGSAMTLTSGYDAAKTAASQDSITALAGDVTSIKTTVEAIEPTDLSGIPAAVRTELATELGRVDVAVSTRSTLTAQDIPEGLTATEVWAATERTLTETPGLPTTQAEQLRKVAQLHGVGAELVVTATARTAGDVSQTITSTEDQTTVSQA